MNNNKRDASRRREDQEANADNWPKRRKGQER